MKHTNIDLTALLGSRICHDLISPLGAIGNGIELLSMGSGTISEEMALITESVANANARVRFFRIAYGAASPAQLVASREAESILSDLSAAGRVDYRWGVQGDQARDQVKLAFLMLQCVESGLPHGGRAQVTKDGDEWHIKGNGDRIRFDAELWSMVHGHSGGIEVKPADIQFLLAAVAANDVGCKLDVSHSETEIFVRF